jgi:hypothetical protein
VAEGARLESVLTRNRHVGSNPTLSASKSEPQRNRQDLQQKFTQSAANCAFPGFEPDREKLQYFR